MRYRKKPIVVDAWQFDPHKWGDRPDWMRALGSKVTIAFAAGEAAEDIFVDTLEGVMRAMPGDWIIRGIKGEVYPCKPDIFAATYELVEP